MQHLKTRYRRGRISESTADFLTSDIKLREIIDPFLASFDITFQDISHLFNTTVHFMFLKPLHHTQHYFGLDREIVLAYSPYAELQQRVFQNISAYLGREPAHGRVDPLIYFLVSNAVNRLEAVKQRMIDGAESHMIITFAQDECISATAGDFVASKIKEQLYTRDLYDIEDPIDDDLFFFGRRRLVFHIMDTIKRGSNIGLFGLRKMGKTSVIYKIRRLVKEENLGEFVYFNLEKPSLYALQWFELLGEIRNRLPGIHKARTTWSEKLAIKAFEQAIRDFIQNRPGKHLVIALDEIEHIAPKLGQRAHWDNQFVEFWKAARAIQSQRRNCCFLIVGANASVIETPMYNGIDNPLFSWARTVYIPSFDLEEVNQMVRTIGRYSGLEWGPASIEYLLEHYGGHPLLTRLACSRAAAALGDADRRPITVGVEFLKATEAERDESIFEHAQHVLGMLEKWYPEEATALKMLGLGDNAAFDQFAKQRPDQVRHLTAYELVSRNPWQVRMPFLIKFLRTDLPLDVGPSRTEEDLEGWSTISDLRNRLEPKLRRLIKRTLMFKFGSERWIDPILRTFPTGDRERLNGVDRDEILQRKLFLTNLIQVITQNWADFAFLSNGSPDITVAKAEFEILGKYINTNRNDAHAKSFLTNEVEVVKLAVSTLERSIDRFLVD
jgi:AAA-like domain